MANKQRRNIRVKFHFLSLTADQVARLGKTFDPAILRIEAGAGLNGADCVQVLNLDESFCGKLAEFVLSEKLSDESYRLYASIVSERDHDGFRLPTCAVKLIQRIGGQVDFAYICTP